MLRRHFGSSSISQHHAWCASSNLPLLLASSSLSLASLSRKTATSGTLISLTSSLSCSPYFFCGSVFAASTRSYSQSSSSSSMPGATKKKRDLKEVKSLLHPRENALPLADELLQLYNKSSEDAPFRAGVDTFLNRVSPPLDPATFFTGVAKWVQEPKEPKSNKGYALYRGLIGKSEYYFTKSLNLHNNFDDVDFFEDLFFPQVMNLHEEIRKRQGKPIDELFGKCPIFEQKFPPCLFYTKTAFWKVQQRHNDATSELHYVPHLEKHSTLELTDGVPNCWLASDGGPLVVIGGPSGAGKTVACFEIGYMCAKKKIGDPKSMLVYFTASEGTKYMRDESKRIVDFESADKTKRDNALHDAIVEMVMQTIRDNNNDSETILIPDENTSGYTKDNTRIIIVFDEIGAEARFLRALASVHDKVAKILHAKFFNEYNPGKVRVHFVASGTGAHSSSKHSRNVVYLTPKKEFQQFAFAK